MKINDTESFCSECGTYHNASVNEENGMVIFFVDCPRGKKRIRISSDAALFMSIRNQGPDPEVHVSTGTPFTWMNILELTSDCNLHCPVCFASAGDGERDYLPYEKALELVKGIRDRGLKAITLSGGEPTLHPDFFRLARAIRGMGLDVTVLTNGIRVAEDPSMAARLKRCGMTFTYIQMDSLDEHTTETIRGENVLRKKLDAVKSLKDAGIYFGIISTVIKDNCGETGDMIRFAVLNGPSCYVLCFLTAVRAGRFTFGDDRLLDREAVIRSIMDSKVISGIEAKHFSPFPRFIPLGIGIHPDCAALLFIAVRGDALEPLDNYCDISRLYSIMGRFRKNRGVLYGKLAFMVISAVCIRPGKLFAVTRMLAGMATKKGKHGILAIAIEQFMGEHYQDRNRLRGCSSCNILPDGSLLSACVFNHPDARRHESIRKNINR